MTPREAIIELNRYIGTEKVSINQQRLNQALGLAIKALKLMIEIEDNRLINAHKVLRALIRAFPDKGMEFYDKLERTIDEVSTVIEAEGVE